MVADHYLLVQRWRPNFLNKAIKEKRVAVWIKIQELALELYNLKFLTRLGSALGCFLKMDQLTTFQSRGQFARICVELNLAKPLVPFVVVRGEKVRLEYEGLHSMCFNCGIYGHKLEVCPMVKVDPRAPVSIGGEKRLRVQGEEKLGFSSVSEGAALEGTIPVQEGASDHRMAIESDMSLSQEVGAENGITQGIFGPWMLSTRKAKKKGITPKWSKATKSGPTEKKRMGSVTGGGGSRFEILENSDILLQDRGDKPIGPSKEKVVINPLDEPMQEEEQNSSTPGSIVKHLN